MGKRNHQRRAEKRRRKQRQAETGRRSGEGPGSGWGPAPSVDALLDAAVEVSWHGDELGLEGLLAMLGREMTGADGGRPLALAVSGRLQRAVRGCWNRGWQPAELAAGAGRQLGPAHRRLCVDAIAAEASSYLGGSVTADPAWLSQLDELGASAPTDGALFDVGCGVGQGLAEPVLRRSIELVGMLEHAPALPCLGPPPSEWGTAGRRTARAGFSPEEGRLLARVRALLSKAESTDFPEEAEALTAKAQELMARHAIDRAAVEGAGPPTVEGRRLVIDDPYAQAKAILLQTVAEANRCRTVWMGDLGLSTVFGPPDELRITDLLYTSLLTQATTAMVAAGARGSHARLASFRRSFLVGYAQRIGERLRQSVEAEVDAGVARHGQSLLPVLARRLEAVDEAVDASFPSTGQRSVSTSNGFGWALGRAAADLADLAVGERLADPRSVERGSPAPAA